EALRDAYGEIFIGEDLLSSIELYLYGPSDYDDEECMNETILTEEDKRILEKIKRELKMDKEDKIIEENKRILRENKEEVERCVEKLEDMVRKAKEEKEESLEPKVEPEYFVTSLRYPAEFEKRLRRLKSRLEKSSLLITTKLSLSEFRRILLLEGVKVLEERLKEEEAKGK
ncbi:MAG: hypothetical protein D6746_17190, partial [Bacteroidetes bacterium]